MAIRRRTRSSIQGRRRSTSPQIAAASSPPIQYAASLAVTSSHQQSSFHFVSISPVCTPTSTLAMSSVTSTNGRHAGRRGQHQALLAELARRYEGPLLGLASGLLGGHERLARDAVQETWLRVIRFGGGFGGRSSFKTWLYRIAINQCRSLQQAEPVDRPLSVVETEPSTESPPDAAALMAEDNDRLRKIVGELGDEKALVLLLCYHEGMTHEQAAEVLGIPLGTLKSRLHAALKVLRGRLSSEAAS